MGGVVNTGRNLPVKYWGVATPATPSALALMPTFHCRPDAARPVASVRAATSDTTER